MSKSLSIGDRVIANDWAQGKLGTITDKVFNPASGMEPKKMVTLDEGGSYWFFERDLTPLPDNGNGKPKSPFVRVGDRVNVEGREGSVTDTAPRHVKVSFRDTCDAGWFDVSDVVWMPFEECDQPGDNEPDDAADHTPITELVSDLLAENQELAKSHQELENLTIFLQGQMDIIEKKVFVALEVVDYATSESHAHACIDTLLHLVTQKLRAALRESQLRYPSDAIPF